MKERKEVTAQDGAAQGALALEIAPDFRTKIGVEVDEGLLFLQRTAAAFGEGGRGWSTHVDDQLADWKRRVLAPEFVVGVRAYCGGEILGGA